VHLEPTYKMIDLIEVFPLPEAPIRRTCTRGYVSTAPRSCDRVYSPFSSCLRWAGWEDGKD
jgi:hypothetical protein